MAGQDAIEDLEKRCLSMLGELIYFMLSPYF